MNSYIAVEKRNQLSFNFSFNPFLFFLYSSVFTSLFFSGHCIDLPSARRGVEIRPACTKLGAGKGTHVPAAPQYSGLHQTETRKRLGKKIKKLKDEYVFPKRSRVHCCKIQVIMCLHARPEAQGF